MREADTEEELRLAVEVARAFVDKGDQLTEEFQKCVSSAVGSCFMLNAVELAREMFQGSHTYIYEVHKIVYS